MEENSLPGYTSKTLLHDHSYYDPNKEDYIENIIKLEPESDPLELTPCLTEHIKDEPETNDDPTTNDDQLNRTNRSVKSDKDTDHGEFIVYASDRAPVRLPARKPWPPPPPRTQQPTLMRRPRAQENVAGNKAMTPMAKLYQKFGEPSISGPETTMKILRKMDPKPGGGNMVTTKVLRKVNLKPGSLKMLPMQLLRKVDSDTNNSSPNTSGSTNTSFPKTFTINLNPNSLNTLNNNNNVPNRDNSVLKTYGLNTNSVFKIYNSVPTSCNSVPKSYNSVPQTGITMNGVTCARPSDASPPAGVFVPKEEILLKNNAERATKRQLKKLQLRLAAYKKKVAALAGKARRLDALTASPLGRLLLGARARRRRPDRRGETGNRWTQEQKALALAIFRKSRKTFNLLNEYMPLPGSSVMIGMLRKLRIPLEPGLYDAALPALARACRRLKPPDRLCALLLDRTELKRKLVLDVDKDRVDGFRDLGGGERGAWVAGYALVLMLQGLRKRYKQPLGHFLLEGDPEPAELADIIADAVRKVSAQGFTVLATVCAGSVAHDAALQLLRERGGGDPLDEHFLLDGQPVWAVSDVPGLLLDVRDRFRRCGQLWWEGRTARWRHLAELADKNAELHVPKLGAALGPEPRARARAGAVRLAAHALSNTVAALLKLRAEACEGAERRELADTAEVVQDLDSLFDVTNGTSGREEAKRKAREFVSSKSVHHVTWELFRAKLLNLEFVGDEEGGAELVRRWRGSLAALAAVWAAAAERGCRWLDLRRLNLDVLLNLFDSLRQRSPGRELTCHNFPEVLSNVETRLGFPPVSEPDRTREICVCPSLFDLHEWLPEDGATPGDEAKPEDATAPEDGVTPGDEAKPEVAAKPGDEAAPENGVTPEDGTALGDDPGGNADSAGNIQTTTEIASISQTTAEMVSISHTSDDPEPAESAPPAAMELTMSAADRAYKFDDELNFEEQPFEYICGFVAQHLLAGVDCARCRELLAAAAGSEDLLRAAALEGWDSSRLTYPSATLCSQVEVLVQTFDEHVKGILYISGILEYCELFLLGTIDPTWQCPEHALQRSQRLARVMSLLLVRNECRKLNEVLSPLEEDTARAPKKAAKRTFKAPKAVAKKRARKGRDSDSVMTTAVVDHHTEVISTRDATPRSIKTRKGAPRAKIDDNSILAACHIPV